MVEQKLMQIDIDSCQALIGERNEWYWSLELAQCPKTYRKICNRLIDCSCFFSLIYRIHPPGGFVVDENWDQAWRDSIVQQTETTDLFGYKENLLENGKEYLVKAICRVYAANSKTQSMLGLANDFTDWQSPFPDNLAGYDPSGNIIFYSIGHELELSIRRNFLLDDLIGQSIDNSHGRTKA